MRPNSTLDGSSAESLRQGFFRRSRGVLQTLGIASLDLVPQGRSLAVGDRDSRGELALLMPSTVSTAIEAKPAVVNSERIFPMS